MTIGWEQSNFTGLYTHTGIGQAVSSHFTPAGILAAFGVPLPMAGIAGGILNLPGLQLLSLADAEVVMGNAMDFHFGSTLEVGSGHRLEYNNSPETWKLKPATGVLALLYAGVSIADAIVPAMMSSEYKSTLADFASMGAGIGALEAILTIWSTVESVSAHTETEEKLLQESFTLAIYNAFNGNANFATTTLGQLATNLANMSMDIARFSSAILKKCDTSYTIEAPEIALRSAAPAVVAPLAPQPPSQIKLAASGNATTKGEITIEAKDKTHISGGDGANFTLETTAPTVGNVILDCGVAGMLTLQSGLLKEPNVLTMDIAGITLRSSLNISLTVDLNYVWITPAEIQLMVDTNFVSVTPAGITLQCGPSSIQITPAGITMSGPSVSITAAGSFTVTLPATQIM
jgi:hypothetical protein